MTSMSYIMSKIANYMQKNKGKKNIISKQIRLSKMLPWYTGLISILVDKKGN